MNKVVKIDNDTFILTGHISSIKIKHSKILKKDDTYKDNYDIIYHMDNGEEYSSKGYNSERECEQDIWEMKV